MIVVKRNGETQKIAISKIHKAVEWACQGLDVSLSEIETNAHIQFFDGIKTAQIHTALVNSAASLIDVGKTDYEFAAARLLLQQIYKEVTQHTDYPTLATYISNAISLEKIKPEMQSFDLEALNDAIDVSRDDLFKYLGMQTVYDRYLLRDENQKLIEMPQHFWMRVAMGIALNETPETCTKWAIEFYNVLSKFEFVSSTPTLFNSGTKFSQMSSCFPANTLISTSNGFKRIDEVMKDERVLTKGGTYETVVATQSKETQSETAEIWVRCLMNSQDEPTLQPTEEHLLWAMTKQDLTPRWIEAGKLQKGDYVHISAPKVETNTTYRLMDYVGEGFVENAGKIHIAKNDVKRGFDNSPGTKCQSVKNEVELDAKLGRLIGYFLAEGHVQTDRLVGFTFNSKDVAWIEDVNALLVEIFEINTTININKDGSTNVYAHSKILARFFEGIIGKGFATKILPIEILQSKNDVLKEMMIGVFRGDGCALKNGMNLCLSNQNLQMQIFQLLVKLGYLPSVCKAHKGKLATVQPYVIRLNYWDAGNLIDAIGKDLHKITNKIQKQRFWHRVRVGNDIFYQVFKTKKRPTRELVFDLQVNNDHSFSAGLITAHNCFVTTTDDSIWEEQEGVNFGKGIFATMTECALYSKFAGGIGTDWTRVRPAGAGIGSTHGMSSGVVPYLKVFNDTAVSVNQCFDGDTRIFTKSGFKAIKNIVVGDMVLGVRGDFNAVYDLRDYDQKEAMLEIDVKHSIDKLKVTDAHPIYAIQGANLETSISDTLNALEKGKLNTDWIEAKKLKVGDYVAQPIPKMVSPIENFTDDDARMYGIMLGDEKDVTDNSFINLPFKREHLYNEDGKKRIHETMMFLPESQTIALIKGLIETDGNISRGKEVTFCSTSLQLVEGLRLLLLRLECPSAANIKEVTGRTIRGVEIADTTAYSVRIPMIEKLANALDVPTLTKFNWLVHNGCVFSRIKEITPVEPSTVVYDLKVDADHSYTTSACVVHNGGKRNGSFAAYLEPWHGDIERFINLKKPNGDERLRAREIFPYIWTNDLFMKRVKARAKWSLFCSHKNAELCETYGEEFERHYLAAEERGDAIKIIDAMELWKGIITALVESGAPLITFKDEHNRRNPQNHVGVIRSSNLCSEISLNTSDEESAVCNLGSINVSVCTQADFPRVIPIAMRMLDNVIDLNFYPTEKARRSNLKHRPVGLGLMGWTDYIISQGIDWESDEHLRLTDFVFEDFSYWAIKSSMEIAKEKGHYNSYDGSKWSQGILPIDTARKLPDEWRHGSRDAESWDTLRTEIQQHGMRNSNCMAIAPTATIANIVGTTPCIEPIYKQVFVKENKSGKFKVVDPAMRHNRPELCKTAFEIDQTWLIKAAAVRQKYIDQSQSVNLFKKANVKGNVISDWYFLAWELGLKSLYYLKQQISELSYEEVIKEDDSPVLLCSIDNSDCEACQ